MTTQPKTLNQIRLMGLEALSRELGPTGMIRFLQQFETGKGDYTLERHEWLDHLSIDNVVEQLEHYRKAE